MEKLLAIWFDNQMQNNKAHSIFETLKAREGEKSTESFTASHGWFQQFRRRFNLYNWRISGEATSVDVEAAEKFVDELDGIIKKGSYCPEQIFSVDEIGLWWKKMPERSYMHKEAKAMPGFKAFKDRITLLLGGNAAGFKLKLFLVYHSENPRALKNVSKNSLPVYYRANKKAWMTQPLFEDWFLNCFIPSVQHYCLKMGVPFKIILLLDNASGHPRHLDDLHPDVKVVYLPKNTTAVLRPMDQGAITTFKAFYLRTTFSQAVAATENDVVTLCDFWKSYSILDCIKNIKSAWDEVTDKCMQCIWKKCIKSFANNIESNLEQTDVIQTIAGLANALNLDVEVEDIAELVDYADGELTNEDLIELEAMQHLEEEEEERTEVVKKKFTVHGLAGVFSKINVAMLELEAMDPNTECFNKVECGMSELLKCYRELYQQKKKITKQTTLTSFFSTVTFRTSALEGTTSVSSSSSPLPGPSTAPDNQINK
ncbi:tigger transposable element-derived protein 1-like [Erpetoichthys calabaricus]|uniref:tigger transposable element-derived protein 1-like n=1 Tax=Erpetoichthys calabaricus TaxID=27687 RepID=UPI00109F3385|nr:tigger transposable element-derived protein 1-like [Erpetoichthys calabaricus]